VSGLENVKFNFQDLTPNSNSRRSQELIGRKLRIRSEGSF
jgi:hypothetical protein